MACNSVLAAAFERGISELRDRQEINNNLHRQTGPVGQPLEPGPMVVQGDERNVCFPACNGLEV